MAVTVIKIPVRISGKRSIPANATSATSSPQEVVRTRYLKRFRITMVILPPTILHLTEISNTYDKKVTTRT